MGIDDIPSQVARVLKYSTRTFGSFLLSLTIATFVVGFSIDLLYGFFYQRLTGEEHARYGQLYWMIFGCTTLLVPIIAGIAAYAASWKLQRRFDPQRYGVAIAPPEVFSLDPDVLGTPTKIQALQDVLKQFFDATKHLLMEKPWFQLFEFRFLPPSVRVSTAQDAERLRIALGASILLWGNVIQQIDKPLYFELHLSGRDTNLNMSGSVDPQSFLLFFQYYLLSATAYSIWKGGEYDSARQLFNFALEPANAIDDRLQSDGKPRTQVAQIRRWLAELDAEVAAHGAAAVADRPKLDPGRLGLRNPTLL